MNTNIENFLLFAKKELKANNIRVYLPKTNTVRVGKAKKESVNGYFDDDDKNNKILKCAIGKPLNEWFPVFVHEYCHFRQCMDECKFWKDFSQYEEDVHFLWIEGKEYDSRTVKDFVKKTINIELDCEKRVVKTTRKFDLPIDITQYIRQSNSYIYFYLYSLMTRKWYKKAPFATPLVYNKFRKDFRGDYSKLPKKYKKLYDKYCI